MDAGPVPVSGPSGHAVSQWPPGSGCPYAAFARTTRCRPLPTAVSHSTPLTRSELALVFRDYW